MPYGAAAPVKITLLYLIPDGYVQASDGIPTDSYGRYQVSVTERAYGSIQVKVRAFEHAAYRPSGSELMIVVPLAGMAIVIAGAGDSALFPVIEQLSDSVVKTFRRRHFVDESCGAGCVFNRIWYLHPDELRHRCGRICRCRCRTNLGESFRCSPHLGGFAHEGQRCFRKPQSPSCSSDTTDDLCHRKCRRSRTIPQSIRTAGRRDSRRLARLVGTVDPESVRLSRCHTSSFAAHPRDR